MNPLLFNALLFLSFFISFEVYSQHSNLKSVEATRYKEKHVIVIETGDSIVDAILLNAVKDKWRFSDSIQSMSLSSSDDYVLDHPDKFIRIQLNLIIGQIVHTHSLGGGHRIELSRTTYGEMLRLLIFEDNPKRKFGVGLQSNTEFSEDIIIELIQRSCGIIEGVEEVGTWTNFCLKKRKNSPEMYQGKTLLVPIEFLKNQSDSTKFKSISPFNIQFVSSSFIKEKVKESSNQYMYIIAIEEIVNYHMHFLCTTNNSHILAVAVKAVQGGGGIKDENKGMYISFKTFKKLMKRI